MELNWQLKSYNELSKSELYDILHLRAEVFVVEQDCPYQDLDYVDQKSYHFYAYQAEKLVAYIRIIPPQIKYPEASIGRVVTSELVRGKGAGKLLMLKGIEQTKLLFPNASIKISAQCYLDKFYKELGFAVTSDVYLEDGIDHQEMLLQN